MPRTWCIVVSDRPLKRLTFVGAGVIDPRQFSLTPLEILAVGLQWSKNSHDRQMEGCGGASANNKACID